VAAVDEERKPILMPADLAAAIRAAADTDIDAAAAIRAAADTDIDAAAALALFAPPDVPLPTHSLALLLRRLFTTRSITSSTSSTIPARTAARAPTRPRAGGCWRSRTPCAAAASRARSPAVPRFSFLPPPPSPGCS
jgi:hypothetical protein